MLGALALGTMLAWWMHGHEDSRPASGHAGAARTRPHSRDHETGDPILYRWVDAAGVVNIATGKPPVGTRYTIVHIDPDRNIVPMRAENPGSPASTMRH